MSINLPFARDPGHVNVQQDVFQAENCKAPRVLATIKKLVTFSNPPIVYSYMY